MSLGVPMISNQDRVSTRLRQRLQRLVEQACAHPPGSSERNAHISQWVQGALSVGWQTLEAFLSSQTERFALAMRGPEAEGRLLTGQFARLIDLKTDR